MDIRFDNVNETSQWAAHLFWAVPLLIAVYVYGFFRRRQALERLASVNLLGYLTAGVSFARQKLRALLVIAAMILLLVALTGPRWGVHYEDVQRKGLDIMFCLDVSRSMLAEDVAPNRLERAKQYIEDMVRQLGGDRVGLVVFAGQPTLQCPLTIDYGTFRMVLDDVGIRSAARGGTLIGDAVRLAANSFTDEMKKYKAIVLITDGEDQASYPVEAAAAAYTENGIRIFTVGIGDLNQGSRIPVTVNGQRVYLQHDGQEVWSRLDTDTLKEMALRGGGAYIPAGTSQVDMGQVYEQKIATTELREFESERVKRYDAQYQWFAGTALLLLLIEAVTRETRRATLQATERMRRAA